MRKYLLLLIVLFSKCSQPKNPDFIKQETDSLFSFMKVTVNTLLRDNKTDTAKKLLDSIFPLIQDINDSKLTRKWLLYKQRHHGIDLNFDSATIYLEKAAKTIDDIKTTEKELLEFKIDQLDLLTRMKKYDSAVAIGNETYYLAKKVDTTALPMICLKLARNYLNMEDYPSLKRYLFEGYNQATEEHLIAIFANHLTFYYEYFDMVDSALYYLRINEKWYAKENTYEKAALYENFGVLLSKKDSLKEGLDYQLKGLAVLKSLNKVDGSTMLNLASTYTKLKDYHTAEAYLDSGLALIAEEGDLLLLKDAWGTKADFYFRQGKYKDAYVALDSSYIYSDMEADSSMRKYTKDIETKYAVKDKDEKIENLIVVNAANEKIRSQQKIIIVITIVATILMIVAVNLFWRRRQLNMRIREAELREQLLRSEMDPHFLFNMLSLLGTSIQDGAKEKSIEYITRFSKLIRFNFETVHSNYVDLSKEIEALDNYLSLQRSFFDGAFDYQIKVFSQEEGSEILIPPKLIQPFVENSIRHGFNNLNRKGKIDILIEKSEDILHCIIDDNGIGMENGNKPHERKKSRHALQITKERLQIISRQTGKNLNFTVSNKLNNSGTRVEIKIPFQFEV